MEPFKMKLFNLKIYFLLAKETQICRTTNKLTKAGHNNDNTKRGKNMIESEFFSE